MDEPQIFAEGQAPLRRGFCCPGIRSAVIICTMMQKPTCNPNSMIALEANSLETIGCLEEKYPYAATLLVYVVLERCLKLYLLKQRKEFSKEDATRMNLDTQVNKHKLGDFEKCDDACFIDLFLTKCTLGNLEQLFGIPDKRYSDHRNKVFHSNLYLKDQLGEDSDYCDEENRQYIEKAKEHLIEASKEYFRQEIIEQEIIDPKRKLCFKKAEPDG